MYRLQELMLQALLTWAAKASAEQADAVQQLLQRCFALASSPNREVRLAFAQEAPALAQPQLLKALYGCHGSLDRADTASLEAKLLQVSFGLCFAAVGFEQQLCMSKHGSCIGKCAKHVPNIDVYSGFLWIFALHLWFLHCTGETAGIPRAVMLVPDTCGHSMAVR